MDLSFWFGVVGTLFGVVGTSVSIYQFAASRASSKRQRELQFVLASINSIALQKQVSFELQYDVYKDLYRGEHLDLDVVRTMAMAKSAFSELAQMTVALEGTIDVKESAILDIQRRANIAAELFNDFKEISKERSIPTESIEPVISTELETSNINAVR